MTLSFFGTRKTLRRIYEEWRLFKMTQNGATNEPFPQKIERNSETVPSEIALQNNSIFSTRFSTSEVICFDCEPIRHSNSVTNTGKQCFL